MQGRPPSSARPSTSARPTTAFDREQFQNHQQRLGQQQQYEIEEEYEEESDDDDVFAFLPPTTADQEQYQQQEQRQHISQSPFTHSAFDTHVQYPEPAFDPWGRPQYPTMSSKNPFVVSTTDVNTSPPAHTAPAHPSPLGPPGVPSHPPPSPSTDSHPSTGMTGPDFYRLRRLGTAVSSKLGIAVEKDDDKEKPQEQGGDDTRKEDEKKVDSGGDADVSDSAPRDKEGYDSDTATSENDMNNITSGRNRSRRRLRSTSPQDLQHRHSQVSAHDADIERDAGLHRRSIKGGGVKTTTPNLSAQPYTMYSKQASSYYGRDVRASVVAASGVDGMAPQDPPDARRRSLSPGAQSSTFQHDAGPSHSHSQSQSQTYHQHVGMGNLGIPQATVSLADSLSMTQSMMEDDESRSIKIEFDFDAIEEEDSPFPEVRASVSNIDDPDMPAMTIRMWFVGLVLCMTSSALNVFFNFRNPAPNVVPLALLLISYPIGKFLAFTLPITTYRIPLPYLPRFIFPINQPSFAPFRLVVNLFLPLTYPRAIEFSLNPGPWNIKEHVLVYIMANVAVGNPYALNAIVVSELYYGIVLGYWFSLTLVLATQLTGFGLAGLCRRFLVWPASMVWPQNLVACTLLNTLHAEDEDDGIGMYGGSPGNGTKGMTRYKFFLITTLASFFFFFLPGYLFQALSVFSFICWVTPTNVPVNQLFGVRSGLGMSILTFDWTQIAWIGSPLMVPWWAEVHIFVGFVIFYWILTPILYYTNTWQLAYFPISANEPFDRFGQPYNVTRVLRPDDTFDEAAYSTYSPLFLPATYAMTYLLAFTLSTCVLVHTMLYHGKNLLNGFKKIRIEPDDIHAKLMRNYPEVPEWWYALAFCFFFSLAIVAVEVWHTDVPVWALLLSILLPVVYILPSGFIYAMTGQGISLNIIAQIIPGSLLPGEPLANMLFKAYSVQTLATGSSFVQDLKLGHYVKVPPRATFMVQMVATTLAAFIQVGVKDWIFNNIPNICQPNQVSQLTCPHNQVFFTASAIWGLIGPTRQFGISSIYHPQLYCIIIGVFIPIPFYLWQRRYPKSWVRYVSTPVVLTGLSAIPPATGINYSSWFLVAFIFQYLIRKKNFAWWSKFNYVFSSALDSGTVIAVIIIFFALQFPKGGVEINWWGNLVPKSTADWNRTALLPIPEGGVPWN